MQQCRQSSKSFRLNWAVTAPVLVFDDANLEQAVQGHHGK
ncbi:hypothetical protein ABVN80_20700 [Acinetobacter baumannii]